MEPGARIRRTARMEKMEDLISPTDFMGNLIATAVTSSPRRKMMQANDRLLGLGGYRVAVFLGTFFCAVFSFLQLLLEYRLLRMPFFVA